MDLDPKLRGEAQPVRLVGAAAERGPIAPSTPAQKLTRASKSAVAQTRPDIRQLDENRPVPKVDVFGAIASIAGHASSTAKTQAQKDEEALKPYARKLAALQDARSKGSQGAKTNINMVTSTFIQNNPRLQDQAVKLLENLTGIKTAIPESLDVNQVHLENVQLYLKSSEGAVVASQAAKLAPSEQMPYIEQFYNRAQSQKAIIEQATLRLQSAKTNKESMALESQNMSEQISQNQASQIRELMDREILPQTIDPDQEFDAMEDLTALRELRSLKAAEFLGEYTAADGITTKDAEARLAEVMEPMDRLISMLEANGEEFNRLAKIQGSKAVLELGRLINDEELGPLFKTPDGMRQLTDALIWNNQLPTAKVAKAYNDRYKINPSGAILDPKGVEDGNDSKTLSQRAIEFFSGEPDARREQITVTSGIMNGPDSLDDSADAAKSFKAGMELIGLVSAGDDVLDNASFDSFIQQNLPRFSQLAALEGEQGTQFTKALNGMFVKQMAINMWDSKQLAKNLPAGFYIDYNDGFSLEFNMKAFLASEGSNAQNIVTALKEKNLPVTEENIMAVLQTPLSFTSKNSPIGGRTSQVNNQPLVLANGAMRELKQRIGRLNSIDSASKNIPTIKDWELEIDAAITRSDQDFRTSQITGDAVITKEDVKVVNESTKDYPSFANDDEADAALADGTIKIGDSIKIGGKVYEVEG
jgi:hypothetical protein